MIRSIFCLANMVVVITTMAQPPSRVYDYGEDIWHYSWTERLTDGRFFGPLFDAPQGRTLNAAMEQVAAWEVMDPGGGLPVIYFGVLNDQRILSFGVVRHQEPPGVPQTKMCVVYSTPEGQIVGQHALLFDGYYQEEMFGGGARNVLISTNHLGEAFICLRTWDAAGDANHILKLGADGMPQWQVRLPEWCYMRGDLTADAQGGCWFSTGSHSEVPGAGSVQVGRLDANGNLLFWNRYARAGATYGGRIMVRDNGDLGFVIAGVEANKLLWMGIDAGGQLDRYLLTSEFEPVNVHDALGGMARVGPEWAVLQGVSDDRLSFFSLDGTFQRAYVDSAITVQDTVHGWWWNTLEGRVGWAMVSGYRMKHDGMGTAYTNEATLTQLKEELWDHCMIKHDAVQQTEVPPSDVGVQPLTGTTFVPLPAVVPGTMYIEQRPLATSELLCMEPVGLAEQQPLSELWLTERVVHRGMPFRLRTGQRGQVALLDMAGRMVLPWTPVSGEEQQVGTATLTRGMYVLAFLSTDGTARYTGRVLVL